ncbi:class IV adenylate cyclase [Streptomyces sp. NPDC004732]|uniref:class IV adenylate cyclase n=1 Tax=Streptomyces sp. NPDC004732 TaxID=3154290 RepID=UPI0033B887CF
MIEAELKAWVREPETVLTRLDERARARSEVYRDTYYDRPDGPLAAADEELRVRTIHGEDSTRTVLTFKAAAVDAASGSKPEHETDVDNAEAAHAILRGLGYVEAIAFEKQCRNYGFEACGRQMLATLVRVPEIDGTFLELETLVDEGAVAEALSDIRAVLADLGISDADLTRGTYTDAVAQQRRSDVIR